MDRHPLYVKIIRSICSVFLLFWIFDVLPGFVVPAALFPILLLEFKYPTFSKSQGFNPHAETYQVYGIKIPRKLYVAILIPLLVIFITLVVWGFIEFFKEGVV